ncbi:MAG: helix-turn-helix domain-containing protein [Spirochaetales bacterium]
MRNKQQKVNKLPIEDFKTESIIKHLSQEQLDYYRQFLENKEMVAFLNDEELITTVKLFLKNNLNITTTSKSAFMHRNTLIYRLEKVKQEVGLNIKNFEEATILENILMLNELLKKN